MVSACLEEGVRDQWQVTTEKTFAYFFIVNILAGFALVGIGNAFGSDETQTIIPGARTDRSTYFAAIIVPRTSLMIRRLHDIELTGWLAVLGLVPLAGLVLDVFCLIADTNPRPNKWGVEPQIPRGSALDDFREQEGYRLPTIRRLPFAIPGPVTANSECMVRRRIASENENDVVGLRECIRPFCELLL